MALPETPEFDEALTHRGHVLGTNAMKIGGVKAGDRVLDVGCNQASTLRSMRDQAQIVAVGIEPGETEAAIAHAHGIDVHIGVLETFEPGEHLFDQVQMLHVLEHVHDPVATLIRLRSLLKPQGRVVICVPDVLQPYGGLKHFFQYPHLYSFSLNTLTGLFRRAGLQPMRMMRGGVAWMMGQPEEDVGPLPRPFHPEMLPSAAQDGAWVANRLLTYEGLEQTRRMVVSGQELPLDLALRLYRRPALPEHLIEVTTALVEALAERQEVAQAIAVLEAAASGPHPQRFTKMCRELLERMSPSTGSTVGLALR